MTDATAISSMPIFSGWPDLVRISSRPRVGGIACAVLMASAAALALSALATKPATRPITPPVHQAVGTPAVNHKVAAHQPGIALEVAKVWTEERALIAAAAKPRVGPDIEYAWSPAGGLSILLANRFPSAAPPSPPPIASAQSDNVPSPTRQESSVPLPPPSPLSRLKVVPRENLSQNPPAATAPQVAAIPQAPEPGFFDFFRKLFGPHTDSAARAMLAANPKSAIYDIADHVVYLPDGDKLEAHSGYGEWLDDPTSINRKDLGVTPPNVYTISLRGQPFHGVRALRLTPVGSGNMYGRDGFLAHTYMLGPNGQSNGCVSFKDYKKFLQAFEDGDVKQLIVVPRIDSAPSQIASAQAGSI